MSSKGGRTDRRARSHRGPASSPTDGSTGCCAGTPTATDYLTAFFVWTVIAAVLVGVMVALTYLALDFCGTTTPLLERHGRFVPGPTVTLHAPKRAVINVTTREYCSTVSKDLYTLEQLGYVDADRRVSRLLALQDVGPDDVHYVLANDTHVPLLFACSVESVLRTVGNRSRVNVFVVLGVDRERPVPDEQRPVLLSSSLAKLRAKYGAGRLNVVHIDLKECLDCSPFQGMDLGKTPGFAKFAVQLVLLWQFGGTVLDHCVVAVRGRVYRATGTAVQYGEWTVSAPVACHEFVYAAMSCAKSYALRFNAFAPDTARRIVDKTVARRTGWRAVDVRPVADGIVCRGGVISGHCYYVEADRAVCDPDSYVFGFCPVVGRSPPPAPAAPRFRERLGDADQVADHV